MNRRDFLALTAAATAALARPSFAEEKRWRIAVIGHSSRGGYGHGLDTMWLKMPETEIVGVADADASGLAAAEKKLSTRGFADYRQMLTEIKPDIVAIGPRHIGEHRDMALAAIAAGARGIYMEKPFCPTLAQCDEVITAAAAGHVKIALAHRNRYHPALLAVRKAIADGAIGRLVEIRGRGKEDARGGALDLWVLGAHVLNLAHFFAGAPRACSATLFQNGTVATAADVREGDEGVGPIAGNEVHARFEMESGVPVFFDSIHDAKSGAGNFGLQLIGTGGIIDLRLDNDPIAQILAGSTFVPSAQPRQWVPISSGGIGVPEPIADLKTQLSSHVTSARDLIAAIREDRAPLCSAEDARVVVEMIMAVFTSHVRGGARVTLPLESRTNPLAA